MEKKQLNFNAPLISTRRYSSPICSSSGEDQQRVSSMVKQYSVSCHKGSTETSVPFLWEQIPGRAKDGSQLQLTTPAEPSSIPKLPPGRTSKSGELIGFRNPNMFSRSQHKLSGELTVLTSRELMMDRFLPEPSRQIMSNIVPFQGREIIGSQKGEDEQSAISVKIKACGFLPWLLCLLNKLQSLKSRSKVALSSTGKLTSLDKTGSWKSFRARSSKHDPCSNVKHKPNEGFKSCELQMPKYTSKPMFYSGELHTRSGSPYRSMRRSTSNRSESPHSPKQVNPNQNRTRTPQKTRPIVVPKSETMYRYGGCKERDCVLQSSFTPPLPRSPSESWLSRKLPLVSPRNSGSNSSLTSKLHSSKQNAKWETIVKSSQLI